MRGRRELDHNRNGRFAVPEPMRFAVVSVVSDLMLWRKELRKLVQAVLEEERKRESHKAKAAMRS